RRHTRSKRDWSSDVCSSDLAKRGFMVAAMNPRFASVDEITDADYVELEREFGDRETAVSTVVLSEQAFIKDAKQTIGDLVKEGKIGRASCRERVGREGGAEY